MTWYSLLPEQLTTIEGWMIRFFVILGTLTIGPWAFIILYDILLYIWRAATYEIPFIGGRARGRGRPVAPSFSERPGGRRRAFSLTGMEYEDENGSMREGAGMDTLTRKGEDNNENEDGGVKTRRVFAGQDDAVAVEDDDDRHG